MYKYHRSFTNFEGTSHSHVYLDASEYAESIRRYGDREHGSLFGGRGLIRAKLRTGDSRLLRLPGEIRNQIYSEVALDAPVVNLFEGRAVLPALGQVCRKVRKEMSGVYEKDVAQDPSKPIHAHVTNFNFHPLSKWLDKYSRDLKDRIEEPRLLCITSVLLSPDCPASSVSPQIPLEERDQQSALDALDNSLRTMEQSLDDWSRTWTACGKLSSNFEGKICEAINFRYDIHNQIVADRSGTAYAVAWNPQTIHRQPYIPRSNPTVKEKMGICYRGDFCHHFLLRNMTRILHRASQGPLRNTSSYRFTTRLKSAMWCSHRWSEYNYVSSFPQHEPLFGYRGPGPFGRLRPSQEEKEIVAFYQWLNRLNITRGVLQQEIEQNWDDASPTRKPEKGTKRTSAQYIEDRRSRDGASREHGRGQVKRRLVDFENISIPNPGMGIFTDDLRLDGITLEEKMELVVWLMEQLELNDV